MNLNLSFEKADRTPPPPHLPRKRSRLAKKSGSMPQDSKTVFMNTVKKSRLIGSTLSHISLFWIQAQKGSRLAKKSVSLPQYSKTMFMNTIKKSRLIRSTLYHISLFWIQAQNTAAEYFISTIVSEKTTFDIQTNHFVKLFCCFFVKLIYSVPSFGIGSSAELGMPRNECFLPRNNGNSSEPIPRNFFGTKFRSQP